MKVLLINGGPHKNGATNRALTEIALTLKEEGIDSEILWLGNEPIAGCIGCGACADECPVGCISEKDGKYVINAEECVDCGACAGACPVEAPAAE